MSRPHRSLFIASPRLKSFCTLTLTFAIAVFVVGLLAGPAPAGDHLAKHPALQPFGVAGKKLPADLFFVRTRVPLTEEDGVVVLGSDKDVFLVSGNPDKVRALMGRGCAVLPVENWEPSAPPAARDWTRIDTPDPDIEAMVNQVEWTGVLDKVQWLVDFGTRYDYAPNHTEVAQAIRDKFASYGLQAELKPFQWDGLTMWSVEATQVGARYPDSYVVICGHFDSISETPMELAPGADDNATGAAAVLTAAEILSQHTFDYSIRYICFGGEELGLIGSFFYTTDVRMQNLDIVGALNFDMLGYWEPGVEKDLEIETNVASQWLADAVLNAADLYTEAEYELHVYDWAWWGDHFYFWMYGYPAVNHEESWDWYDPDFNPYYHSTQDLPQYIDPDFTVENIRVGVASLATLADATASIQTTFDVQPGSCPNPFNPKSNGVTTVALLGTGDFDVNDISMATLRLEGVVSPVWVRIADVGSAVQGNGHPCADTTPDGIADLSMKFATQDIAAALGPVIKRDAVTLGLTCRLVDGTVIEGEDVVTIVGETDGPMLTGKTTATPETFALYQNVPNPFNPVTTIRYDVPAGGGDVSLCVYDVSGRLVRVLVNGRQTAGEKAVTWDGLNEAGSSVATGVYFYRLIAGDFNEVRKMTILK
jgi:hypothetical protein